MKSFLPFLLAAAAAAIAPGLAGPPQEVSPPPQEAQPSPERENLASLVENCRKCHEDVCSEWEATQHAKSWTDPVFQAQIADLPDKGESCARCHAPQELLLTGYGNVPLARQKDREKGVNCVTCHMKGNSYFGPYESTGHGGVDASEEFRKPALCLSCHGRPEARKEHDQGTSYLAGPAPGEGKTCQSCHMPGVERKLVTAAHIKEKYIIGVQPCRMHAFTGARRGEVVPGCADLALRFEGTQLLAEITARTGHCLPATTDREVVLEVVFEDVKGASAGKEVRTWRFPDGPVLDPGRATPVTLAVPPGAGKAKASLRHVLLKTGGREEPIIQPIAETTATK